MGKKDTGLKKGAPHHFTGHKRTWLDSQSSKFHLARAAGLGEIAAFYDDVTRDFLVIFPNIKIPSIDDAIGDDSLVDQLPLNSLEQQPPAEELTQAQADANTKIFDTLRLVRLISCAKQSQY